MGKVAYIFPGQGAQYIGMGKEFYDEFGDSKDIFHKASDIVSIDIPKLVFEENDNLNITEYTQIAMVTTCMAILTQVNKLECKPLVFAGLSLGEYPAIIASGAMNFEDGIKVVRKRGILMQEAVPTGVGAMAAVLGLDANVIEQICEETDGIVTIANYNCPGQIVISGLKESVEVASEALTKAGAKRVIPLNVSGPFHSPLLKEAGEKLRKELDKVAIQTPLIPYVSNVNAGFVKESDGIKDSLTKQVYSPVKWQQSVETMIKDGIDTFIEIGPGRTLSAFIKKINRSCTVMNIEKIADLDKIQEAINVRE